MKNEKYTGGTGYLWEYDDDGNLVSTTKPDGEIVDYTYDSEGYLMTEIYSKDGIVSIINVHNRENFNIKSIIFEGGERRVKYSID